MRPVHGGIAFHIYLDFVPVFDITQFTTLVIEYVQSDVGWYRNMEFTTPAMDAFAFNSAQDLKGR
jgi:hypothetical protein